MSNKLTIAIVDDEAKKYLEFLRDGIKTCDEKHKELLNRNDELEIKATRLGIKVNGLEIEIVDLENKLIMT